MTTQSKFVVMKHEAKRAGLHYDLRFKLPKSKDWDSYAVPKGVPTASGQKALAIKTTIHSEKEALLTGNIKDGYGAGRLTKWDGGSCTILKYSDRHISIDFKGSKVKGVYHLISTGVMDKDFNKPTYLIFKGKSIKESTGMASKVPTGGIAVDTEEGQTEETGEPLKWSISEAIENNPQYAMICQFKAMKGFFKQKPAGDFLILAIKDKDSFMLLQFFQHIKNDLYLVGFVGGGSSNNESDLETAMDQMRYNTMIRVLEDYMPITIRTGMDFTFTRPSKYLGRRIKLSKDSRLPQGYFIAKCNIKDGFEPAITYKIKDGAKALDQAKKMRAFTSSRLRK